jgi:hypothetical protein
MGAGRKLALGIGVALLLLAGLRSQALWGGVGTRSDPAFQAACADTGVRVLAAPSAPVHTVSVDWKSGDYDILTRYRVGPANAFEGIDRVDTVPDMLAPPEQADVNVTHTTSDPARAGMGFRVRGLERYVLTATDRRNGATLGTFAFAVDPSKGLACGMNTASAIDVDAFVRQVTSLPGHPTTPPGPTEVTLEVVGRDVYDPPRETDTDTFKTALIRQSAIDDDACKALVKPVEGAPGMMAFVQDPTGHHRVDFRKPNRICRADAVYLVDNLPDPMNGRLMDVLKYTATGELAYHVRMHRPKAMRGIDGGVASDSVRSEGGYLAFDVEHADYTGGNRSWRVEGRTHARFKEPAAASAPGA